MSGGPGLKHRGTRCKSVGGPVKIIGGPDLQTGGSTRIGWGGGLNQNRLYLVDPQRRSPGPLPYLSGGLALFTGPPTDLHRAPRCFRLDRAPHSFTPGPPGLNLWGRTADSQLAVGVNQLRPYLAQLTNEVAIYQLKPVQDKNYCSTYYKPA